MSTWCSSQRMTIPIISGNAMPPAARNSRAFFEDVVSRVSFLRACSDSWRDSISIARGVFNVRLLSAFLHQARLRYQSTGVGHNLEFVAICPRGSLRLNFKRSPPLDTRKVNGSPVQFGVNSPPVVVCERLRRTVRNAPATCESNYPTTTIFPSLSPAPRRPPHCFMTSSEPREVGNAPTDVGDHSATTATLSADIETLTTSRDIVEATPVKAILGSVIVILTLVRVSLFVSFHSPTRLSAGNTIRMK